MTACFVLIWISINLVFATIDSEYPLFETYQGYNDGEIGQRFKDKFDKYIDIENRDNLRVLHIGAKTSDFCERLYEDGFRFIDNIDLMEEKMETMRKRMEKLNIPIGDNITFQVGDMFKFGEKNSYDIVIDKGVVELSPNGFTKYLPHCWSILKTNGLFVHIGPFPPYGSKENGWWISDQMSPSNWKKDIKIKNDFKLLAIETIDNTYIRVPSPDKFYMYFLRKIERNQSSTKNKQEI